MLTIDDVKQSLTRFLAQHLKTDLGEEDRIFESGRVNSLFAMQLVLFVEKEFGISVTNEDLEIANFESIGSIARLVARKNGAGG
jgi:acyl carrier protein